MKISIENLGPIKQAEYTLGDLTIICGGNNTGKTYATYALFGFLYDWNQFLSIHIPDETIEQLLNDGSIDFDVQEYIERVPEILDYGCERYSESLHYFFASPERYLKESVFKLSLDISEITPKEKYKASLGSARNDLFSISKSRDSSIVNMSLLAEKGKVRYPNDVLSQMIGNILKEIIFSRVFPKPFISSAERTGAAVFKDELNFLQNESSKSGTISSENEIDSFVDLLKLKANYALPVKVNLEFIKRLKEFSKYDSFITKQHPDILDDFAVIAGGDYEVTENDEIFFIPEGSRIKLTMKESSSAVRSLLDIGAYLRHVAAPGDLLMIDEPELNLHPENQRRMARLFAKLVNIGMKVFITTHSDYIIKELNTLIMLKQDKPHIRDIIEQEGYGADELLSYDRIRVYIAEKDDEAGQQSLYYTLFPADIDPELGIEVRTFDKVIGEMNQIQEEIVWGEEE